jgi:TRAP-type mannitol/chloroaromatic compound transport system permease small subunit
MSTPTEIKIDLAKVEDASSRAHALDFPHTWLTGKIEAVLNVIGGAVNWLWIILVLIIVVNVTMRYAVGVNYIWVEEVQWHIYAVGFMIAIGYGIIHDAHVRVDVIAAGFKPRTRAIIEFIGITVLILPLIYLMISYAIPFVESSWRRNETSSAPGGLTNRWAIKSVIIIAFAYMGLAAVSRLLRVGAFLLGTSRPRAEA